MDNSKRHYIKIIISCVLTLLIVNGCTTIHPKRPRPIDEMHNILQQGINADQTKVKPKQISRVPRSVSDALLPSVNPYVAPESQFSQRHFNVVADKMPAKVFFTGLVDGTPYNMVVDPNIDGTISLNLKNVTIEEAMDAVRDMYGYEYRKTSYGYEVQPPELQTQIFNVNYLDVKRTGKSVTAVTSGQISNTLGTISVGGAATSTNTGGQGGSYSGGTTVPSSSTVDTSSEVNFWKDLQVTLKEIVPVQKGRSIIVNPQAGVVIVHAYPMELHQVARYLDRIQSNLQRQVIIEAKILEVQLGNQFQAGIDWGFLGNPLVSQSGNGPALGGLNGSNGAQPNIPYFNGDGSYADSNLKRFDSIFTIAHRTTFSALVRFLQTQGNVQTLSNPRISTVNNQKAVIKVGQDEFFVTGVSTTNSVVGNNTLPSQDVSLTPFFSGVTLDVTPQISRDGSVILHIHPSVSLVTEQQKNITLGTGGGLGTQPNILILPLALSTIRESDNIVRAKSGQVVVIGGLMQNTMIEDVGGTPILSRIPFFGFLFRRTSQQMKKTELVILLRPILVQNHTWREELKEQDRRMQADKRDFHAGGWPRVFGNEGERTDT